MNNRMSEDNHNTDLEEFFDLLGTKLSASWQEGLKLLQKQRSAVISKAAANGSFGSGRTFLIISELFENHLKIRNRVILATINDVSQGFDLEENAQGPVEDFCLKKLEQEKNDLIQEMLKNTPFKQSGFMKAEQLQKITQDRLTSIEGIYEQERTLLSAEIKLHFRRKRMANNDAKGGPVVHIGGNVQNLQIGDNNTMLIDQSQKTVILDSFNEIRETLKDTDLIEATKYQEINELMTECENELEKETPNKSRIGACLSTVGQAISGIATLGSAYQAIKMFVPLFGGPPLP